MEDTNEKQEPILDQYFATLTLDDELKKLYEEFDLDKDKDRFYEKSNLNKIRSENHFRYHNIDFIKLDDLTEDINVYVRSIKDLYKLIKPKSLLTESLTKATQNKTVLDKIYDYLDIIDKKVDATLKKIISNNNVKQAKFSIELFKKLDIPNKTKNKLIDLYSDLVLCDSYIEEDKFLNLKRQIQRKRYISEIYETLGVKEPNPFDISKSTEIDELNQKIEKARNKYNNKLQYLTDIMPKGKNNKLKLGKIKNMILTLFSYDDTSMLATRKVYDKLQNSKELDDEIKDLENYFIEIIEKNNKEREFVFDKVGIINIKRSLDYISLYYMDSLDEESKNVITYIINNISVGKYDAKNANEALKIIVDDIWKNSITDIKNYDPDKEYFFLCANNPFIDEKYQTILITNKEIQKVNDYEDYQIGFICGYDKNILYVTENDDIMSVKYDDMSNLKTPKQIEDEFINFKVCNRIALNGFKTVLQAVYIIDDGDDKKMAKAIDLSNSYNLPLIKIIKSK